MSPTVYDERLEDRARLSVRIHNICLRFLSPQYCRALGYKFCGFAAGIKIAS